MSKCIEAKWTFGKMKNLTLVDIQMGRGRLNIWQRKPRRFWQIQKFNRHWYAVLVGRGCLINVEDLKVKSLGKQKVPVDQGQSNTQHERSIGGDLLTCELQERKVYSRLGQFSFLGEDLTKNKCFRVKATDSSN